jgi:hypothetical protein
MPPSLEPGGQLSFLVILSDALGLYTFSQNADFRPEETLCTALIFLHRYQRWNENQTDKEMTLDRNVPLLPLFNHSSPLQHQYPLPQKQPNIHAECVKFWSQHIGWFPTAF